MSPRWDGRVDRGSCGDKSFDEDRLRVGPAEVPFSSPGPGGRGSGSSSSLMGKCPRGWGEKESKKDELLMPRLTPVTPMPRESAGKTKAKLTPDRGDKQQPNWCLISMFDVLTCSH